MPETKLPTKLSELLRLAVSDAQKCEQDPNVELDMGRWLTAIRSPGGNETCYACMAGAVMLRTLKIHAADFEDNRVEPEFLDDIAVENSLYAIDALRLGQLQNAANYTGTGVGAPQCERLANIIRPRIRHLAGGFLAPWSTYLKAADYLEEQGL